ncbi:hypothetical protein EV193_104343 [Herbihabitans rhizosphaerae]|uniref:Uncharacterized protein n=1 Tax=Herbihabitans rhizosphaerae TaxID=1872711 RepID=A0A4Q7KRM5_9PSEU|nr:hypothetical protein [Herbihabitans rhizosphaerae]RZS39127.1 hypothetical protein EV193_104343 [Herbihabitans rhizosphaerae]
MAVIDIRATGRDGKEWVDADLVPVPGLSQTLQLAQALKDLAALLIAHWDEHGDDEEAPE